ncbi:uncharacterized protein [Nicotiana tomentosiformis]|uniref:uncharacterized protein n=1 Tax=Nicotiana tomentosiformis TaxID=4098 RepID=UPI00388C834D
MTTYSSEQLARIYLHEIVHLHGMPVSIISDQGTQFTLQFWRTVQRKLGTKVELSTAFHPYMDRQFEHTIQILEDMLRDCVIDFGGSWDQFLMLAEFTYNNRYQSMDERVLLRVSPMKGLMRFGKKAKLSPRYIGTFEILGRVGEVAYRLPLPPSLSRVHSVFHDSMLRKYYGDPSLVLDFRSVQLDNDLTYVEESVAILDKQVWKLRLKNIPSVRGHWRDSVLVVAVFKSSLECLRGFKPIVTIKPEIEPIVSTKEHKRFERWWKTYKASRPAGATQLTWTRRDELCNEFEHLRHGGMIVSEYAINVMELFHHASPLVSAERDMKVEEIEYGQNGEFKLMLECLLEGGNKEQNALVEHLENSL